MVVLTFSVLDGKHFFLVNEGYRSVIIVSETLLE